MKLSSSSICSGVGRVIVVLLLAAAATALFPQRGEAQCAACSFDANCIDFPVGANACAAGSYFVSTDDGTGGYWLDWCFTLDGECEWIMHLDFADDGTAYAQGEPVSSMHELTNLELEKAETLRQTCDGVLLATRRADDGDVLRDYPITLTL
ncbi:MAG: hypothetical protein OXT63_02365 [Gemmatimonadota bacterium]|nr:hypothetical protein [Gemmatimonadota bacterium]